ncbi:MAK10-like protein [Tanacetum coccineum]
MLEGLSPLPRGDTWTPPGCHMAPVDPFVDWRSTTVDWWLTDGPAAVWRRWSTVVRGSVAGTRYCSASVQGSDYRVSTRFGFRWFWKHTCHASIGGSGISIAGSNYDFMDSDRFHLMRELDLYHVNVVQNKDFSKLNTITELAKEMNDPRDFAKPVKAITLPQDVPSTSDRRLIELENQVQRLMEAHLALTQPTQVNKITTPCEICSGPHDTQYCMENLKQASVDYTSSRINKVGGKRFTPNHGTRNFNDATNTWKEKPNFNLAHTQTFISPQGESVFVHSSSYQMKLKNALLDFDSNHKKMKFHGKSIAAISHDKREELRKKGIKSPLKLLSPKYLSPASIKELNKNLSAPKRVHFVNSIIILNTDSDTEEEDTSSTNAYEHELGKEVKEHDKKEDEMETDMEVEEVIKEDESEFEADEEVEEILEEEEDDKDGENFNSFPTMKELTHHEWLLKNPRPPWVKAKIRAGSPNNIKISYMVDHFFKTHAYIYLESPINIMSRRQYNQIMTYGLRSRQKPSNPNKTSNFVGRIRGLNIFIGSFTYECDFMILEDTTSIIDHHLGEMIFGRPFIEETSLVYNKEEESVMFKQDNEKITFKMPHTMKILEQTRLMGLSTNSIPPSAYEENFGHRRTHYYQSLLIGDEYKQDGGDRRGIRHLMRLEKDMMDNKGKVTLYLMRRSLEVLRKFHWMILGG